MKPDEPLVSIISPAYNSSAYIDKTITSVCAQSYTNFELIIIDDGSTDNTPELIKQWIEKDQRIQLIVQKNAGPANARNKGLKVAKGAYICFIDTDDLYDENKIIRQVEILEKNTDINLAFHDMFYMDDSGTVLERSHHERMNFPESAKDYLTKRNNIFVEKKNFYNFMSAYKVSISTQTIMFRQCLLTEQPYWFLEDMNNGEDTDFWFRLAKNGGVAYLAQKLAYYRLTDGSLTKNKENAALGFIHTQGINYQRAKGLLSTKEDRLYRYRIAREHEILAYYYRKKKQKLKSIEYYLKSFKYRFAIINFFNILKVLLLP